MSGKRGKWDGMPSLPTSAPHPAAAEVHRWCLDDFTQLRRLRAALRAAIDESPPGSSAGVDLDEVSDRVAVVATELATNALRHGRPPTLVRLLRDRDRLILDVADHDLGARPEVDPDRPLGAGGLGLQLTQSFAIEVGWYVTDVTKHVWASFPG
jgi:serine/threonine-protein kinase RsbW